MRRLLAAILKILPLGITLPLGLGAAAVSPDDAASNLSKWAHALGVHNVPDWLVAQHVDQWFIVILVYLSGGYSYYLVRLWYYPIREFFHQLFARERRSSYGFTASGHSGDAPRLSSSGNTSQPKTDRTTAAATEGAQPKWTKRASLVVVARPPSKSLSMFQSGPIVDGIANRVCSACKHADYGPVGVSEDPVCTKHVDSVRGEYSFCRDIRTNPAFCGNGEWFEPRDDA